MRRSGVVCVPMISLLLSACGTGDGTIGLQEQVLAIRSNYLEHTGCTAQLRVSADYGQRVYAYTVNVTATQEETALVVEQPQELAGLAVRMGGAQGQLEYNGAILETGTLDVQGLTPLSAVPILLEHARSGFIDSCTVETLGERETLRVLCSDPEQAAGQGREITLWFDAQTHALVRGELAVDGIRVILCEFLEFSLL